MAHATLLKLSSILFSISALSCGTGTEPNAPHQVKDLAASFVGSDSVVLNWTQVDDGTGGVSNYLVRYGSPNITWDAANGTEQLVNGTAIGDEATYTYRGLTPKTKYQFQTVAFRGAASLSAPNGPLSNIVTVTTDSAAGVVDSSVDSVDASPASHTFTAIDENAQITATAFKAGAVVPGQSFNFSSTNVAIVSVDNAGLMTAHDTGSALIIVSAACCSNARPDTVSTNVDTSTSGAPPYYSDGFEDATVGNGVGGRGANGFTWRGWQGNPSTPSDGQGTVSTDVAHSGTKSLKMTYLGVGAGSDDYSEEYFALKPSGTELKEVWMEWWVYFPSNYSWRYTESPNNTKLWHIWAENYAVTGDALASLEYISGGSPVASAHTTIWGKVNGVATTNGDANTDLSTIFSSSATVAGAWHQLRFHARVGDNSTDFGIVQSWFDGVTVLKTHTNFMIYQDAGVVDNGSNVGPFGVPHNWWRNGYLFGWSNAGFANNTTFYVDDVKVYDANPGW